MADIPTLQELRLKRYEAALVDIAGCRAKYSATGFPMAVHPNAAAYMEAVAEAALEGRAYTFPDRPVIPSTPLVFDDRTLIETPGWPWFPPSWGAWLRRMLSKLKDKPYESR